MHIQPRTSCRICGNINLESVINFGDQHLQGIFLKENDIVPKRRAPLELVRCLVDDEDSCGLLQLKHTIPKELLYSRYWYRSGTTSTMRRHLAGIAEEAIAIHPYAQYALDIGSNDGTLLNSYPNDGVIGFGIDPSNIEFNSERFHYYRDFFPSPALKEDIYMRSSDRGADIVTSIAMMYDLDNPIAFALGVRGVLALDGVWIFEQSYMPEMLSLSAYDTICHEHLEYYSLSVLETLCKKAGLKIFNATLNSCNGASIRCFACRKDCYAFDRPEFKNNLWNIRVNEFNMGLDSDEPYREFARNVVVHKQALKNLLLGLKEEGKKIHVYGASTKGNVMLQWCDTSTDLIECAADRDPNKWGATMLGSGIPIVSEKESRSKNPDYYLVLPWHFREEFLERERGSNVKMIFPLPQIEIISV